MYYEYVLFPKLKAEDHYIAPTRWQDFAFLAIFWTSAVVLSIVSFLLIRFAMKPRPRDDTCGEVSYRLIGKLP